MVELEAMSNTEELLAPKEVSKPEQESSKSVLETAAADSTITTPDQDESGLWCKACLSSHSEIWKIIEKPSKGRWSTKTGLTGDQILKQIWSWLSLKFAQIEKTYRSSKNRSDAARVQLIWYVKKMLNELSKYWNKRTACFDEYYIRYKAFYDQIKVLLDSEPMT